MEGSLRFSTRDLTAGGSDHALALGAALGDGLAALRAASDWLLETYPADADTAAAGATPYLKLFGIVAGGWIMARSLLAAEAALAAGEGDPAFFEARCLLARFYGDAILPEAIGLSHIVRQAGTTTLKLAEGQF